MRQFTLKEHFGDNAGGSFTFGVGSLPMGVCLNPECDTYKKCELVKAKLSAKCPSCSIQLAFSHRARNFTKQRHRALKKQKLEALTKAFGL